jgi:hypothetical protein
MVVSALVVLLDSMGLLLLVPAFVLFVEVVLARP